MTRRMALAVAGLPGNSVRDPTGASAPRGYVFDDIFAKRYDDSVLPVARSRWGLPAWARLALEVQRRRAEYDVVLSWGERVTFALMALQRLSPGKPHVAMMYWFSRHSSQIPMRTFGASLHAIVTWSSVQRDFAIERLGIAPEKLYLVKHYVDQLFWSPRETQSEMICAAGAEMRDYPTLLKALRGTGLRCHIAADHVRVDRFGLARRIEMSAFSDMRGPNVTIGRMPPTELRELYAKSRFVVVPLEASDTDNGITVILEAMAMGKPVICSRTQGQVDAIEDGVTGIFVPVGDADALRDAMLRLWNDPARASEMGRAARAYAERHHTLEKFTRDVKGAIDASLDGPAAARGGSLALHG